MSTMRSDAVPVAVAPAVIDRTYILHDQLGQGGMGAVYEAENRITGEHIALKLVSDEHHDLDEEVHAPVPLHGAAAGPIGTDAEDSAVSRRRLALMREFQTLASLHHPHVVRVLSYGFDQTRGPYYTMELLRDPQTVVEAGKDRPLRDKIQLLAQLLRALEYVHRRGICHRDIKPNNVLCVRDEVKLLDFGIAARGDQPSDLAGTVSYMAPELLFGAQASPASDLYSVGVLFWQMLTGTLPYARARSDQLMHKLLGTPTEQTLPVRVVQIIEEYGSGTVPEQSKSQPETLSQDLVTQKALELAGQLSETATELPLDDLGEAKDIVGPVLRRLLERRKAQRYQQASEVLNDLRNALGETLPLETVATRESFLQAAELVGREPELELLSRALRKAREGQGSGFLIGGESGVGKSRLLQELATQALVEGALLLRGHSAIEGRTLYHEWRSIVRSLCLHVEVRDDEAAVLQWVVPDLRGLLKRSFAAAGKAVKAQAAEALKQAVESLVRRLGRPLVLILEDLHWAGPESLVLLEHLSQKAATLPLLLLSSYRHDESPRLCERLPAMSLLRLERLTPDHVARLCDLMLGPTANTTQLREFLYRETEGNAFFIVEVMRTLAEQSGELAAVATGDVGENVRTLGMEQVLRRRVERVPEKYRSLLALAAAVGREVDLKVVTHVAPEASSPEWLRASANAAVLEYQEGAWRFTHDKLREYVLSQQTREKKIELHRNIAAAMETLYGEGDLDDHCAAIGHHLAQAREHDRAASYLVRAGDHAMRMLLNPAARVHYAEAVSALEQLPNSPEVQRRRADALIKQTRVSLIADPSEQNLARLAAAENLLTTSVGADESPTADDELQLARVHYFMGRAHHYAGRYPDAIRCYQRVLPVAQRFSDPELIAMPAGMLGFSLTCQGHVARGSALLEQALHHLDPVLEPYEFLRTSGILAAALAACGRTVAARTEMERALSRAKEINQPSGLALVHGLCSCAYVFIGEWQAAITHGEIIVELSLKTGDKVHQFIGNGLLAWAHGALGHHDLVQQHRSACQALAQSMGGRVMLGDWFDAIAAENAIRSGNLQEALESAQRVAAQGHAARLPLSTGIALRAAGAALVRLHHERFAEAEQLFISSIEALDSGGIASEIARTHHAWAEAALLIGDRAAWREHLTQAANGFRTCGCEDALREIEQKLAAQ